MGVGMFEAALAIARYPHGRRLSHSGLQKGFRRLVGQMSGDLQNAVLGCLAHGVQPILRHAPVQQVIIRGAREEEGLAHRLFHVALDDDVLDRLPYLDDLCGAGTGMPFELAALGPVVGVVMVSHIGQQGLTIQLVQHDADVAVDAGGPEIRVAGPVDPVERQTRALRVLLDVKKP